MTPNIPILSWAPDADPTTPGLITDLENLLPTTRGYAPDYSLAASKRMPLTLPARVLSADAAQIESAYVAFFGTASNIYVGQDSTLTLRSRVAPYAPTNEGLEWRFAVLGQRVVATNPLNALQSTPNCTTTSFSDVAGGPSGTTICVQRNFVVQASFLSLTAAWPYLDGWWCSAQEDATDWTVDIATQCARGRLTATPGGIIRLISFQDTIIAFKFNSMYRGTYTGPTANTWSWPVLSASIGIISHDAVCEAEGALYWMGPNGFYTYNGAQIQRLPNAPWSVAKDLVKGLRTVRCVYDPIRRLVRWYLTSDALSDGKAYGIALHLETGRWGRFQDNSNCVFNIAVDRVPTLTAFSAFQADSMPWTAQRPVAVIDATTNEVKTYSAAPAASSFTTGDIGSDDDVVAMTKARLRCLTSPTTSSMTHYHRMNLGDTLTTGETASRSDGKYDISHAARWHRLKFAQTGAYEVSGFSVEPVRSGRR